MMEEQAMMSATPSMTAARTTSIATPEFAATPNLGVRPAGTSTPISGNLSFQDQNPGGFLPKKRKRLDYPSSSMLHTPVVNMNLSTVNIADVSVGSTWALDYSTSTVPDQQGPSAVLRPGEKYHM